MKAKIIGIIWGFLLFLSMGATQNENETVANVATFFFGGSAVFIAIACLLLTVKWGEFLKKFGTILWLFSTAVLCAQTPADYNNLLQNYIQLQQECSPQAYYAPQAAQPVAKNIKSPCNPEKFNTAYVPYHFTMADTLQQTFTMFYLRIGSVDQSTRLGGYPPNTFRVTHFEQYASAQGFEMALWGGWRTEAEALTNKLWLEGKGYCGIQIYRFHKTIKYPVVIAHATGYYEKRE